MSKRYVTGRMLPRRALFVFLGLVALIVQGTARTALADPPAPQLEAPSQWDIPFDYAPPLRPLIVVQASINGKEPMAFILDTGADVGVSFFPWAAKQLGLKPTGQVIEANKGEVKLTVLEGGTLTFVTRKPGATFRVNFVGSTQIEAPFPLETYEDIKIAGFLGASLLMHVASSIDFDDKIWTVYRNREAPRPTGDRVSWTVPFAPFGPGKTPSTPTVKVLARDGSGNLLAVQELTLDTGSSITVFPLKSGKELGAIPRADSRTFARVAQGLNSSHVADEILLPQMDLGTATPAQVDVLLSDRTMNRALGLNVLARYRITLSPAEKVLHLQERPNFKPLLLGDTGFHITSDKDGIIYVSSVLPSGAATGNNAVRVGDRLISIDGRDVTRAPLSLARTLLYSYEGTPAILKVQTGRDLPRTVVVPRASRYALWGKKPK